MYTKLFFFIIVFLLSFSAVKATDPQIFGVEQKLNAISVFANSDPEKSITLSYITQGEPNQSRTYVLVDLSKIPNDSQIVDAFLDLDQEFCIGESMELSIAKVTSPWNLDSITWANKPGFSSPVNHIKVECSNDLIRVEISEVIKALRSGDNYGIVIYGPDEKGTLDYTRVFNINSAKTNILIDYQDSQVSTTTTPSNGTNTTQVRKLYLVAIAVVLLLIIVIIGLIFMILRKKKVKNPLKNDRINKDNNAKSINLETSNET